MQLFQVKQSICIKIKEYGYSNTLIKIHHPSVYLQAGMFYLPYYLWSHLEGGMIEAFGKDAKSAVILKDDPDSK